MVHSSPSNFFHKILGSLTSMITSLKIASPNKIPINSYLREDSQENRLNQKYFVGWGFN